MSTASDSTQWYLSSNGQVQGPYSETQLRSGIVRGALHPQTLACPAGQESWKELRLWPAFAAAGPTAPRPPMVTPPYQSQATPARLATVSATPSNISPEILNLARAHQRFTIGIGVILTLVFVVMNTVNNLGVPGCILIGVIVAGVQFYLALELTKALKSANSIIWLVFSLVPIFGVIGIGLLSTHATTKLQSAGIPVGFLGPKIPRQ